MDKYEFDVEKIKVEEMKKGFSFRSGGRNKRFVYTCLKHHMINGNWMKHFRKLTAPVKRWEHKAKIDSSEPNGCGFPVCAAVDMRPKRFKSLCSMAAWMKEEGMNRRIFEVQKGGCEDVSK